MKLWDCVHLAGKQLLRRRMRAFLCAFSVGVGVSAMLLIAALGLCGREQLGTALERIGLSGMTIYQAEDSSGQRLTARQAQEIQSCFSSTVTHAMPIKAQSAYYRAVRKSGSAVLLGTDEQLGQVMNLTVVKGQLFSAAQVQAGERVAVVDTSLAQKLYGRVNILGKTLRVSANGSEDVYRVIGIIEPQTAAFGTLVQAVAPTLVYVPYACLATQDEAADQIFIQCDAQADAEKIGEQLLQFLMNRQGVSGTLTIQDLGGTLAQAQSMVSVVTLVFLAVAAVSFVVAMLGVVSGLLSATHEKTAEIGMYMAIGARKCDILQLFLCQSVLICIAGGIGGICFTELLLFIAGKCLALTLALPLSFTWFVLLLSALCGALAGLLPALWAAKLHPIDAMRRG